MSEALLQISLMNRVLIFTRISKEAAFEVHEGRKLCIHSLLLVLCSVTLQDYRNGIQALAGVSQWTEHRPANQKIAGSILVGAHAWVASWVPSQRHARDSQLMYVQHIDVSLPLFLTLFSSLQKYIKIKSLSWLVWLSGLNAGLLTKGSPV